MAATRVVGRRLMEEIAFGLFERLVTVRKESAAVRLLGPQA